MKGPYFENFQCIMENFMKYGKNKLLGKKKWKWEDMKNTRHGEDKEKSWFYELNIWWSINNTKDNNGRENG